MGAQAARTSIPNTLAVQQHQLRDCGRDYREGEWHAFAAVPADPRVQSARHEERGTTQIRKSSATPTPPVTCVSGLGPLRLAPKEGKGWLFAAGELAMPAADLARWDISIMDQKLLEAGVVSGIRNRSCS